jgi:hypothetical protein
MSCQKTQNFSKPLLLSFSLILLSNTIFSQKADSLQSTTQFSGAVTVTNNGISVIPTFTLGKPATIFDFVVSKNRFSFEPQLRFAIEDAKPWSFIFWMRYKLVQSEKFRMGMGAHPSFVFQTTSISTNGVSKDLITIRRFFASELTPTYFLTKDISIGLYYLYSRGLADATRNTNFIALNTNFSNIKLGKALFMKFAPQVYYLRLDDKEGYYVTSTVTMAKQNFPVAISSTFNKKIQSSIVTDDFLWNVSLIYSY